MAAQSSRNPPAGWVRRTEKKEDGTQVKCYVNLKTKTTVYSPEDMFRYLYGETGPDYPREEPSRIDYREHSFYFSPSYWGLPEDVVNQRCSCGKVGVLACFSDQFRRWYVKGGPEKVSNQYCCRCKELGHATSACPLPDIVDWPRVTSSKSTVVSPHGIIFELPKSPTVERHQEPPVARLFRPPTAEHQQGLPVSRPYLAPTAEHPQSPPAVECPQGQPFACPHGSTLRRPNVPPRIIQTQPTRERRLVTRRRPTHCSQCGQTGHNIPTCSKKSSWL